MACDLYIHVLLFLLCSQCTQVWILFLGPVLFTTCVHWAFIYIITAFFPLQGMQKQLEAAFFATYKV